MLREGYIAHHNFCPGWLGGEVRDKIGRIGLYVIRKVLAWTCGV